MVSSKKRFDISDPRTHVLTQKTCILFSFTYYILEDSWLESTYINTSTLQGRNKPRTNCNGTGTESSMSNNENSSECLVQQDTTQRTVVNTHCGILSTKKDVSIVDENNVVKNCDNSFTNYRQEEILEQDISVHNVHGESKHNIEHSIIDSASEGECDSSDDENSVTYIAKRVEKLDQINFDDSDISIDSDDDVEDI